MCRGRNEPDGPRVCASCARRRHAEIAEAVTRSAAEQVAVSQELAGDQPPNPTTKPKFPKLRDLTGTTTHAGHRIDTERLLVRTRRALLRELDEQGVPADHPIRGPINRPVDAVVVARNAQGQITGSMALGVSDRRGYPYVAIDNLRAAAWSAPGTGTALVAEAARLAQAVGGELSVHGAVTDAIGFYKRMGAAFENPFSSIGKWTVDARDALACGTPIAAAPSNRAGATGSTSGSTSGRPSPSTTLTNQTPTP